MPVNPRIYEFIADWEVNQETRGIKFPIDRYEVKELTGALGEIYNIEIFDSQTQPFVLVTLTKKCP